MIISYFGDGNFELKCKQGKIYTEPAKINDFSIPGPGEYESAGISIEYSGGISIYQAEGFNIAHLGKRKEPLSDSEIEKLSNSDVLFIPIGGKDIFSVKDAMTAISEIEPKIVIPMYFDDLQEFCNARKIPNEPLESYKLAESDLCADEAKTIILKSIK